MATIERTISVDVPLDKVWTFLSDFTTTEQWDPGTQRTTRVSGDGSVGTVYENVSKIAGHSTTIEYTVTDYRPRELLRLQGKATGVVLRDTLTFAGDESRATVTYQAELEPQGIAKLAEPLARLGLAKLGNDAEKSLRDSLQQLG